MPDIIAVLLAVASAAGYIVYRYAIRKSGACSCGITPCSAMACSGCCHCAAQQTIPLPASAAPQQQKENARRTINLRQMQIGETATVTAITARGELGRRIRDMGLVPGATVEIVGRAPLKDPVALHLQGFTLTLRNNEADWITVALLPQEKPPQP